MHWLTFHTPPNPCMAVESIRVPQARQTMLVLFSLFEDRRNHQHIAQDVTLNTDRYRVQPREVYSDVAMKEPNGLRYSLDRREQGYP